MCPCPRRSMGGDGRGRAPGARMHSALTQQVAAHWHGTVGLQPSDACCAGSATCQRARAAHGCGHELPRRWSTDVVEGRSGARAERIARTHHADLRRKRCRSRTSARRSAACVRIRGSRRPDARMWHRRSRRGCGRRALASDTIVPAREAAENRVAALTAACGHVGRGGDLVEVPRRRQATERSSVALRRTFSRRTALVCSCEMRLSVTPSISPISRRVSSS